MSVSVLGQGVLMSVILIRLACTHVRARCIALHITGVPSMQGVTNYPKATHQEKLHILPQDPEEEISRASV